MSLSARRAWIEICVLVVQVLFDGSLSARRAWIEIPSPCATAPALTWSLSARRAWIEIESDAYPLLYVSVALRKESVDRNRDNEMALQEGMSRSPQGERG